LSTEDRGRISERCTGIGYGYVAAHKPGGNTVSGNREGREGGVGDSGEADFRGQVLAEPGPGIDKLAAQVGVAEVGGQGRAEDVGIGAKDGLDADIGDI